MNDDLKILIVDSDAAYRAFLSEVVAQTEGAQVVDTASNGRLAMAKLKHHSVDLVLLEVELPLMDGLETLQRLRDSHPHVGVVMVSTSRSEDNEKVIKALQIGALDFISKLDMDAGGSGAMILRRRLMTVMGLFRARRNALLAKKLYDERPSLTNATLVREVRKPVAAAEATPPNAVPVESKLPKAIVSNPKVEVLAIGVSTGGPNALAQVIPLLPGDLGIPLLLVQHMPPALTASLAESLNKKSALQVREAVHGEEVLPNTVYLAPGGAHMVVVCERKAGALVPIRRIQLTSSPPVNSCRPSVDVLFQSIAQAYDGAVLAVIMTGMGSDGKEGVRALKSKSCYCLAQTEETCVVYGMPRAVIEAGLSDRNVPLDDMAQCITELVQSKSIRVK